MTALNASHTLKMSPFPGHPSALKRSYRKKGERQDTGYQRIALPTTKDTEDNVIDCRGEEESIHGEGKNYWKHLGTGGDDSFYEVENSMGLQVQGGWCAQRGEKRKEKPGIEA